MLTPGNLLKLTTLTLLTTLTACSGGGDSEIGRAHV